MPGLSISPIGSPTFFIFGYFFKTQSVIVFSPPATLCVALRAGLVLPSACTEIPDGLSMAMIFLSSYKIFIFIGRKYFSAEKFRDPLLALGLPMADDMLRTHKTF